MPKILVRPSRTGFGTFNLKAVAALTIFCGAPLLSQNGVQTGVHSPAKSATPSPQASQPGLGFADLPSAPVLTLKTSTRRVVVDVVVTDAKGHPVTGLTRDDFSVAEDSKPQPVRSFEMHTVANEAPYVPPVVPKLPPNTFLNLARAPASGTPTVILYDVLNTPLNDQMYAHQEIVRFLNHRKPGTQIAIFVLSDKLHLLQGFTEDTDKLSTSLGQAKGGPTASSLIAPTSGPSTISSIAPPAGTVAPPGGAPPSAGYTAITAQALNDLNHMEAMDNSFLLDRRVDATLDALTEIGQFLTSIPGRKNLIWLSASFPAGILPDPTISVDSLGQDQSIRNYDPEIKQATDLLNLAHVAVYPVDARGLTTGTTFSAAAPNGSFDSSGTTLAKSISDTDTKKNVERSTMESIADGTGGHAFINTNDLQQAVDSAMLNGSTYYSLSYSPTNPNFDGSLRKISVKLKQAGYTLSYRRSYFADDLNAAAQAVEDAPQNPLTPSLEYGTPISHELFVEAHMDVVGPPVPATPRQMELLSQYEAMRSRKKARSKPGPLPPVMMQQYLIQYGLIPRQLDLPTTSSGAHVASIEFGVISYDDDGLKLNGIDTKIEDNIPAARYSKLADEGYHVAQTFIVPVTAASVRLAVRDTHSNRIGSLEVRLPLAKTAEATTPALKSLEK